MPSNLIIELRRLVLQPRELVVYPNLTRTGVIGLNCSSSAELCFELESCKDTSKPKPDASLLFCKPQRSYCG